MFVLVHTVIAQHHNAKILYIYRVSSRIFQVGGGGGTATLTSPILYLITMLGKSLTRPFPDVDILL